MYLCLTHLKSFQHFFSTNDIAIFEHNLIQCYHFGDWQEQNVYIFLSFVSQTEDTSTWKNANRITYLKDNNRNQRTVCYLFFMKRLAGRFWIPWLSVSKELNINIIWMFYELRASNTSLKRFINNNWLHVMMRLDATHKNDSITFGNSRYQVALKYKLTVNVHLFRILTSAIAIIDSKFRNSNHKK